MPASAAASTCAAAAYKVRIDASVTFHALLAQRRDPEGGGAHLYCLLVLHLQLAPFMRQPAPADNIYELLSPVWWVLEGQSLSSYPMASFWPQLIAYINSNGKAPFAGIMALCGLVLLSLVFFVLW